jgi:N-acetylmuramoyl-L-alanine amidase
MRFRGLAPLAIVLMLVSTSAAAPRLPAVEHKERAYIELTKAAASLRTKLEAPSAGTQAHLRSGNKVVTLTRNGSRVLVNGKPVVLDAPVRVKDGVWLVPHSFVSRVRPALAAGPSAPVVAAAPPRVPAAPVAAAAAPRVTATPLAAGASRVAAAPVEISLEDVRVRSYPSFTRIVVETSAAITHRIESGGGKEARIRLVGLPAGPRVSEIRDGFIAEIRVERAGPDSILRVIYEATPGTLRGLTLTDPPRLVLDANRPTEPITPDARAHHAPLKTIVLDAGHGGHDTGAIGPSGLMEKDLVLDVTRRVAKLVEERLGIKVRLTRDNDHFVTLRDRTSFANRERADLFVSIHANAHRASAAVGVETYFLSSEATDSAARQVAAAENGVVQLEPPAGRPSGQVDIVKAILWDLAQSEFQAESSRLAEVVHDSMTQSLRIANRGVKQAGFYVLGGAAMPAILIEIGFVTNPREERRLKEPKYRDEIARAILAGLAEYKRAWDQKVRSAADPASLSRAR